MSRSRKKSVGIYKDPSNKGMKEIYNRKIRRKPIRIDEDGEYVDEMPMAKGQHYKKENESWDISDFTFYEPDKEEWIKGWLEHNMWRHPDMTEEEARKIADRKYRKLYENK